MLSLLNNDNNTSLMMSQRHVKVSLYVVFSINNGNNDIKFSGIKQN